MRAQATAAASCRGRVDRRRRVDHFAPAQPSRSTGTVVRGTESMKPRPREAAGLLAVVLLVGGAQTLWQRHAGRGIAVQVADAARPGDIEMYSSITCPICARARAWFEEHRVPYTECLIERDAACSARFRALASPGTPTLRVRGQRLIGFDPQAIARALATPVGSSR